MYLAFSSFGHKSWLLLKMKISFGGFIGADICLHHKTVQSGTRARPCSRGARHRRAGLLQVTAAVSTER